MHSRLPIALLIAVVAAAPLARSDDQTAFRKQIDVVMRVRVPEGVTAFARSTNGSVSVDPNSADVGAATTTGDVALTRNGL